MDDDFGDLDGDFKDDFDDEFATEDEDEDDGFGDDFIDKGVRWLNNIEIYDKNPEKFSGFFIGFSIQSLHLFR